jgi:hypothetical protein
VKDRYSYLCFLDTESGELLEESRVPTTPEALERRFGSERSLRIAIEAGTHSPWASRILEECGHEVLVADARKIRLIYANKRKTDEIDALRTWFAWHAWIPGCCIRSSTVAKAPRLTNIELGLSAVAPNPSGASILDLKQRTKPSNEKAGG